MRKKTTPLTFTQIAGLGAMVIANKLLERKGDKQPEQISDKEELDKKLLTVSLLYHAIGIFYND